MFYLLVILFMVIAQKDAFYLNFLLYTIFFFQVFNPYTVIFHFFPSVITPSHPSHPPHKQYIYLTYTPEWRTSMTLSDLSDATIYNISITAVAGRNI